MFGYQNLQVKVSIWLKEDGISMHTLMRTAHLQLYYTPDHLDTYVGLSYRDVVTPEKHGVKPDSILHLLTHFIPRGVLLTPALLPS